MQYTDSAIDFHYEWKHAGRDVLVCHHGHAKDGCILDIFIDSCFEHNLLHDASKADYTRWEPIWNSGGDLDENEEFVAWVNRLVDARMPAHEEWEREHTA